MALITTKCFSKIKYYVSGPLNSRFTTYLKLVYQNFYVVSALSVLPSRLLLDKKKWWKDDGNHINEEVFSYICLIYGFDFLLVTKGVFIRTHLHQGNNGMDIDYAIDWHGFFRPVRKRASI